MSMGFIDVLARATQPWADYYAQSDVLQVVAGFGHAGAILVAGLTALSADRAVLRAVRLPRLRSAALAQLQGAHGRVFAGLAFALLTGLTMLSGQIAILFPSFWFWIKMTGLAALAWNGRRILHAERAVGSEPQREELWRALATPARTSAALWLCIALLGVILTTVA